MDSRSRAMHKAAKIALMGFDVDGVLTDGTLYFSSAGDEIKAFSSLDGHGIKMLMAAGIHVAIISGRSSRALELRAENLGIRHLFMGADDKPRVMSELLASLSLDFARAGYMGDDVVDIPILRACGFAATVADGHEEVRRDVDFVSLRGGGKGGAREVCDFILDAQGRLAPMMAAYRQQSSARS
ncbi:MAG: phenylphosphate carboxylase subunit delta [Rhodocyclaceae bacterium]|nr:phenylphosphate carboxylase subunit delta [Rhodocyclaceae bacterium]